MQLSFELADYIFVQGMLFPINLLHVALVPLYAAQVAVGSTHPAPFVTQPNLYTAQAAFVVNVVGAFEQMVDEQGEVVS